MYSAFGSLLSVVLLENSSSSGISGILSGMRSEDGKTINRMSNFKKAFISTRVFSKFVSADIAIDDSCAYTEHSILFNFGLNHCMWGCAKPNVPIALVNFASR